MESENFNEQRKYVRFFTTSPFSLLCIVAVFLLAMIGPVSAAAPVVTGISPAFGNAHFVVTITGTGFSGATDVYFGSVKNPYWWDIVSDNEIICVIPEGVGTVDVTVTTPEGTSATSEADKFTYNPPVITELFPAYGSAAGGTSVAIIGSGLSSITGVTFGSIPATSFTIEDDQTIRAISPAGTGTVDVTVTGPDGSASSGISGHSYIYEVAPTVTGVSPSSGPAYSWVTITGTGFSGATGVYFGSVRVLEGQYIVSDNEIYSQIPDGAGTVDVTVITPEGTSATSDADKFTYAPVINTISPTYGPAAGGTSVAIYGTSLSGITGVTFGSTPATSFTIDSNQVITALSPSGTGPADVAVTGPGGSASSSTGGYVFLYEVAPTVTGVSPSSGAANYGVTITGTGFSGATDVYFGSVRNTLWWHVVSDNEIYGMVPNGFGTVDVTVITPEGTSATSDADKFTYNPPVITYLDPAYGSTAGGTSVAILGSGLSGITGVTFGSIPATSFTIESDQVITPIAPAGTGMVDVTVTGPGGSASSSTGGHSFSYESAAPTVTGVSPLSGTAHSWVTITGTRFMAATGVSFGGVPAVAWEPLSENQILAYTPAGTGTVDVTVTSPGGTSAISPADRYTYAVPGPAAPVVTGISPATGPEAGGNEVIISGSGFDGATGVFFSSTAAPIVSVSNTGTSITVTTPAGTGTVDVTVTTPGGTSAISPADKYTYEPAVNPVPEFPTLLLPVTLIISFLGVVLIVREGRRT